MEKEEYVIKEHENIKYNLYNLNQNKIQVKTLLLACHGFCSNKDSFSIEQVVKKLKGEQIPIISFNWPGHGDNEKELTVSNCINTFKIMEEEISRNFPNAKILLYGSSFGAYIVLLLFSKNLIDNNRYQYVFFKSPAIKMDEIFRTQIVEEDFEEYQKRGYTIKNRKKKMVIPYEFYEELCENRLNIENLKNIIKNAIIFHGTEDDVAPIKDSEMLEGNNIRVVRLLGAPHSFDGEFLDEMIEKMLNIIHYIKTKSEEKNRE